MRQLLERPEHLEGRAPPTVEERRVRPRHEKRPGVWTPRTAGIALAFGAAWTAFLWLAVEGSVAMFGNPWLSP
jgi:hypothetical protein